jgi:hypothetical protein
MALIITDPTTLISGGDTGTAFAAPLSLDTSTKTITITPGSGILPTAADGVTGQALYSALKLLWKNNSTYIKFPFPMEAITPEEFEFISGWAPANDTTRKALRTCGWVERSSDNTTILRTYSGIVSLGDLGATDQPYYQQNSTTQAPVNFAFQGPVNEAISVKIVATCASATDVDAGTDTFTFPNHGFVDGDRVVFTTSNTAPTGLAPGTYYIVNKTANTFQVEATVGAGPTLFSTTGTGNQIFTKDSTTYLKLFAREYQKTYSSSNLASIGVSTLTYIVYRFPLSNATDLNINTVDGTVSTTLPYTDINVTYLAGTGFAAWSGATAYVINDVVSSGGRWYRCILGHTNQVPPNVTYWVAYEGERQLGSSYYAYNVIIDGDVAANGGYPSTTQIYEKIQYLLRQNSDIDAGTGVVTGKTADALLTFVGSTLVTSPGVFIDDFDSNFTNSIEFFDYGGVKRTYPFVAAGNLQLNANLVSDGNAKYWMFFTTLPGAGNDFGESGAVIVQDSLGVDITGTVVGGTVPWTFNYDSNNQGGRTPGTDAAVTVVAIGLTTGQYVSTTATITRSTGQNISLVASLERNYSNP